MSDVEGGPVTPEDDSVEFHQGEVLIRLAQQYVGLQQILLEAIQNGMDADGDRILVGVNLKSRVVNVLDNGTGTDESSFRQALKSIGKSGKTNKFGKFGLGLISPVDECETYLFTSWARTDDNVRQWCFRETEIKPQAKLRIPPTVQPSFPVLPKWLKPHSSGTFGVGWRTMVHLKKLKPRPSSSTLDLDELAVEIRSRFSIAMLERGIVVRVVCVGNDGVTEVRDIEAMKFDGEPLPVVEYDTPETGKVTFRLHRAPELAGGQRRGEIVVMQTSDNTAVSMRNFQRQALGGKWAADLKAPFAALMSGNLEGVIECELLQLDVSRKKFDFNVNEAVQGLYVVLGAWYYDHGSQYFEAEREQHRETRWAGSAQQAHNWLQTQARQPALRPLVMAVEDSLQTTSGQAAAPIFRPSPPAPRAGAAKREPKPTAEPQVGKDQGEKPKSSQPRARGGSLTIVHRASSSSRLFELDFETLEIVINVRHPVWEMLDETDGRHTSRNARWILSLQQWLLLQVISVLTAGPSQEQFEQNRRPIDVQVKPYATLFIMGSRPKQDPDDV